MNDKLQRELEDLCLQILRDRAENPERMLASARSLYEKLIVLNHENSAATTTESSQTLDAKQPIVRPEPAKTTPPEVKESPKVKAPASKEEQPIKKVDIKEKTEQEPKAPEPKKAAKEIPVAPKNNMLHQRIQPKALKVGLNDRIAFVKKLFHGQTDDFNRVLSQINTFSTYEEADSFLTNLVIPEYSWDMEEEYAIRFTNLVRMRFGLDEIPEE